MPMIMAKSSGSVSPPVTGIFLKKAEGLEQNGPNGPGETS